MQHIEPYTQCVPHRFVDSFSLARAVRLFLYGKYEKYKKKPHRIRTSLYATSSRIKWIRKCIIWYIRINRPAGAVCMEKSLRKEQNTRAHVENMVCLVIQSSDTSTHTGKWFPYGKKLQNVTHGLCAIFHTRRFYFFFCKKVLLWCRSKQMSGFYGFVFWANIYFSYWLPARKYLTYSCNSFK